MTLSGHLVFCTLGRFGADAVLPVGDDEPEEGKDDDGFDTEVEALEDLLEARIGVELRAELHADIGQDVAPGPGAEKGVEMKAELVHPGNAGGKGDEGTDDGEHASDEHGDGAEAVEEAVNEVQIAAAEQEIAAVALNHGPTSACANPVRGDGSEIGGERGHGGEEDELHLRMGEGIAGQRHDDFRGDRNTGGLDGHQQDDAEVAAGGDGAYKKRDDFL